MPIDTRATINISTLIWLRHSRLHKNSGTSQGWLHKIPFDIYIISTLVKTLPFAYKKVEHKICEQQKLEYLRQYYNNAKIKLKLFRLRIIGIICPIQKVLHIFTIVKYSLMKSMAHLTLGFELAKLPTMTTEAFITEVMEFYEGQLII